MSKHDTPATPRTGKRLLVAGSSPVPDPTQLFIKL